MNTAARRPVKGLHPEIGVYNIVYAFSGNKRFYSCFPATEAAQ